MQVNLQFLIEIYGLCEASAIGLRVTYLATNLFATVLGGLIEAHIIVQRRALVDQGSMSR